MQQSVLRYASAWLICIRKLLSYFALSDPHLSQRSSGIGGGGFMTIRIPPDFPEGKSEVYTIDFREMAPALANSTMYRDDPTLSRFGGLAVGVPGELRGLEEAHRRWGKLPWSRLVQPSVVLARSRRVDVELARRIPVRF